MSDDDRRNYRDDWLPSRHVSQHYQWDSTSPSTVGPSNYWHYHLSARPGRLCYRLQRRLPAAALGRLYRYSSNHVIIHIISLLLCYWSPGRGIWFRSCLSVCLSVCLSDDNFQKPWHRKFIFTHPVCLQRIRVKFIYTGHWVKVTGVKRVQNPYFRNVKLRSATPVL